MSSCLLHASLHERGFVAPRLSLLYVSIGEPARVSWLCGLQRRGLLGIVSLRYSKLKGWWQPPEAPMSLRLLQGALVMSESKGHKTHSTKHMGVASYSGRQGHNHFFNVIFEDGHAKVFTVTQVRARVEANSKPSSRTRAITTPYASSQVPFH